MTRGIVGLVLASVLAGTAPLGAAGPEDAARKVAVRGGGSYAVVTPAALAAMLARKDFLLVNVHIPYQGEIAATDRFIPFDAIQANRDKLPARKDAKILLYCLSGPMSTIAARALVGLGYTNVWELDGGMTAWEESGRPVTRRR